MIKPNVLVLTGEGINCDHETKKAFELAGGLAKLVHVNDLACKNDKLDNYQILAVPGGFSYGDHTGAGKALANKIRNHLGEVILDFAQDKGKLVIGICNGFQVLAKLGLLPALDGVYGMPQVALVSNDFPRYKDRWCDIRFEGKSYWTIGINKIIPIPIAHGEGKFHASPEVLKQISEKGLVAARYVRGDVCKWLGYEDYNPNGSLEDIAGITNEDGRIFGLMPHPERGMYFTQLPHWTWIKEQVKREGGKIPEYAGGLEIFKNGVRYFE
ncbi:MAG: phosphoribosylformylglycinamidine synthase subunit PurQ [archaeon]